MGGNGRGKRGGGGKVRSVIVSHLKLMENLGMVPDRRKPDCHRCGRPKTEPACVETLRWAEGIALSRVSQSGEARLAGADRGRALLAGGVRRKRKSVVHPRVKARPKDKARRSVAGEGEADPS